MADITPEQDQQIRKLKRRLEGWRTVLLPIRDILVWEQDWYPGITIGAVTLVYFIFWLWNPSVLTGFAAFGLVLNLIDYTVPIATHSLHPATIWTGQQERQFEDICTKIVQGYHGFKNILGSFFQMRETSPRLYHTSLIGCLLLMAWIGASINNLFLLYFLTLIVVTWPALAHRNIPQSYSRAIMRFLDSRKHR